MNKIIFSTIAILLCICSIEHSASLNLIKTPVPEVSGFGSENLLHPDWIPQRADHTFENMGGKFKITALQDLDWVNMAQDFIFLRDWVPPEGLIFSVIVEGLDSTWDLTPGIYPRMLVGGVGMQSIASIPFDRGDGKYLIPISRDQLNEGGMRMTAFLHANSPQSAGNYVYVTPSLIFGTFKPLANVYSFSYDGLSRLTDAIYYKDVQPTDSYSEKGIAYDRNGNIQTLHRSGQDGDIIQDLSYEYEGNQLKTLHNTAPTATETYTYTYDENGNMTFDGRQGMELDYNYLNLVNSVTNGSTGEVKAQYKWHADGSKLSVRTGDGNDGYEYLGSLVYKRVNGVLELESAAFGEGRIYTTSGISPSGGTSGNVVRPTTSIGTGPAMSAPPPEDHVVPGSGRAMIPGIDPVEPEPVDPPIDPIDPVDPVPVEPGEPGDGGNTGGDVGTAHNHQTAYFIMDHLGSVRVVVDNNGNVLSRHDYYPFGLTMPNRDLQTGDNRYLYNGKELQQMASLDFLDYGTRMYDAISGRWFNIDSWTEMAQNWSPYRHGFNNPVRYLDNKGKFEFESKYAAMYPRFAYYLKNGIQEIEHNPRIMNALMKYGEFKKEQIIEHLQWGSGPRVIPIAMDLDFYGLFNSGRTIFMNDFYLKALENAKGYDRDILLFLLAVTLLHEYVHYGDIQDGIHQSWEEGIEFEKAAYGSIITQNKASELIMKWINNNITINSRENDIETTRKRNAFNSFVRNYNNLEEGVYEWNGSDFTLTR